MFAVLLRVYEIGFRNYVLMNFMDVHKLFDVD